MATNFYLHSAAVLAMMGGTGNQSLRDHINAVTTPFIKIYDGAIPANADAATTGTILAELAVNATDAFSGVATSGINARATFAAITSDASANATGTASYFRLLNTDGTTVKAQGTVGTSAADLILNTVAITSGSTVSITSATIDLPRGVD